MKLYNTLSRTIEEFEPLADQEVKLYTCGPTVYREIHIGNFRTYLTTDLLRRVLKWNGYDVTSVMNITDVGHFRYSESSGKVIDPVMEEAKQKGVTPLEISKEYTRLFLEDGKALNLLDQDVMPKATEHIQEMIEIIKILIEKKYAYEAEGNVYFDVKKFKDYGKLSGNTLDKMDQLLEAVRVSLETDKKDSADFALWKKAAEDQVMKWESPWGDGVPGWHIECSAMSIRYLGDTFDIHGGGKDLIFPHHEDEIAQSEAASGVPFVKYWMHTEFLQVEGEKMSRSKRNVFTLHDLEKKRLKPIAFRYLTFQTHYRTNMNFTWKGLQGAQNALEKLYALAETLPDPHVQTLSDYEFEFEDAINTDLNMPKAVSVMWEMVRSKEDPAKIAATLYKMDEVLGLRIRETLESQKNIPEDIQHMFADRNRMRKQGMYDQADQLRNKIENLGYVIEDSAKGSRILRKI